MSLGEFCPAEAFERNRGLIRPDEQERLAGACVALAGCGGVGGVHAHTLARLGVGSFRLADPDRFSLANFNRQIGATMQTLDAPKARVTADMIKSINPGAQTQVLEEPIGAGNAHAFLDGVDLVVDGVDFFALGARRALTAAAERRGVATLIAAPLGFSGTLHIFADGGMSFDDYFNLRAGQSSYDQYVHFLLGLAPSALHAPYTDLSTADPATGRGPSSIIGSQLAACLVGAEAVRILLGRGPSLLAPHYLQVDVYRRHIAAGYLRWGVRHPLQRLKKLVIKRYLRSHGLDRALMALEPA